MNAPQPILVTHLFPETLASLVDLVSNISQDDWNKPTVCSKWSVKDVVAHLLGTKLGILSRKRDRYPSSGVITDWSELVTLINNLNASWVQAASRLSPRVLCDLLKSSGEQVCDYFRSLDPYAIGDPVNWAGTEPAPVWFDLAREHTEWWHHQQQIRDAVGKPGLKEPRFFAPVIDAFIRALPHTFREVEAEINTLVALTISGDSGGRWIVRRHETEWKLYVAENESADAETVIDQDIAWRVFTRGICKDEALRYAIIKGNRALGLKTLEMISVIA